jgi:hypothetical protein
VTTGTEFSLLGRLVVRRDSVLVPLPRGKQRALLATLLLNANHVVSLDELTESLWGSDPPPSARVTIQNRYHLAARYHGQAAAIFHDLGDETAEAEALYARDADEVRAAGNSPAPAGGTVGALAPAGPDAGAVVEPGAEDSGGEDPGGEDPGDCGCGDDPLGPVRDGMGIGNTSVGLGSGLAG